MLYAAAVAAAAVEYNQKAGMTARPLLTFQYIAAGKVPHLPDPKHLQQQL
jgi:hypothetical protein